MDQPWQPPQAAIQLQQSSLPGGSSGGHQWLHPGSAGGTTSGCTQVLQWLQPDAAGSQQRRPAAGAGRPGSATAAAGCGRGWGSRRGSSIQRFDP